MTGMVSDISNAEVAAYVQEDGGQVNDLAPRSTNSTAMQQQRSRSPTSNVVGNLPSRLFELSSFTGDAIVESLRSQSGRLRGKTWNSQHYILRAS